MNKFQIDNKKIAKNTLALYFRMAFTMIVSFFSARITLEVLGSEDYGLNNLVGGVVAMFSFINGSMGTAVQRFYSIAIGENNIEKLKKIFGCGLYLHIIIAIITFIIAEIFAFAFLHRLNIPIERMGAAQVVFQLAVISLIVNIINVPYAAILRAREQFTTVAYADIFSSVLKLLFLYALYIIEFDKLIIYSILNFIIHIFYSLFLFCKARQFEEAKSSMCRDRSLIKEMLTFVSFLLFTVLAQVVRDNGITILVNLFFGLAYNAAFAIATQIMHIVTTFVTNFKQSLIPQLMSSYGAGDKKSMFSLINTGTKITFLLMLIISVPIVFESDFLLGIWLKTPPQYSSQLVSLAVISVNISSFTYFLYQAVHATGKIKWQQITISSMYFLNIALIYIAYKLGGTFYWGYYVTILISIIQCFVNIFYAKKHIGLIISSFFRNIIIPSCIILLAISLSMFFIINLMKIGWIRLFVICITDLIICIFLGYFVLLDSKEKMSIKSFVKNAINKKKYQL